MKIVIQRCLEASVQVDGLIVAQINKGLVLLVCIEKTDQEKNIAEAAQKIIQLRCFQDSTTGKMGSTLSQMNGEILAISQFTLSWDGKKGNRPSFDLSAPPDQAKLLFDGFVQQLLQSAPVKTGIFGADMKVQLINDGPVTFTLSF
jgi:D-tyrosyl-tRNA(Tyr) deacylase